jgi:phospholipid/cholesterol/gamma-HCH transport system permease protein
MVDSHSVPPGRRSQAHSVPPGPRSFRIEHVRVDAKRGVLKFYGRLTFADSAELWKEVRKYSARSKRGNVLDVDLSEAEMVDGGAMALLVHLRAEVHRRGARSEFVNAPAHIQDLVHLYKGDGAVVRRKRRRPVGLLDQIGRATMETLTEFQLVLAFLGEMVIAAFGALRAPRSMNWKEVAPTMERSGADALPITVLINLLVGLVMGLQSSAQLRRFGAEIFVADLVGISMARELGPLMTAIIATGRSGAAFAAELGSMQINEEIDALRTMGFGPMRFLVIPRALGLMLVLPLLTAIADLVGMIGGLAVGVWSLNLTASGYWNETQKAVKFWDVSSGLIKSCAFALAIALISCQQGLAASGGAEGVGRRTTSAVVATLFALILIDTVFTLFFQAGRL